MVTKSRLSLKIGVNPFFSRAIKQLGENMTISKLLFALTNALLLFSLTAIGNPTIINRKTKTIVRTNYASAYVFRGDTLNHNPVIQPSLTVEGLNHFSFTLWGNFDLFQENPGERNKFSELDLNVQYEIPINVKPVYLSVGYTEFTYPAGNEADRELNLQVRGDIFLQPQLSINYATDGAVKSDIYIEAKISQLLYRLKEIYQTLTLKAGYIDSLQGIDGVSHVQLSSEIRYKSIIASAHHFVETDKNLINYDIEKKKTEYFSIGMIKTF